MKYVKSIYHFLGGVYFALILISCVALFVIAGTFIESLTQSHGYAALFTYDNPLFGAFLWGFFINILFSATRRWPFEWKHIPFLTTHLGLLMILAGVLGKHYFGMQGSMHLSEGGASHEIMESNTYAINVYRRNSDKPFRYPLQKKIGGSFKSEIAKNDDNLSIRLLDYCPHCKEHLASWVKGSHAVIGGLNPIPLHIVKTHEDKLPLGGRARFHQSDTSIWNLYALKTSDMEQTLSKLYSQNARLIVTDRITKTVVSNTPLEDAFFLGDGLSARLSLNFSSIEGFENPSLILKRNSDEITIPLSGDQALLNINLNPILGQFPLAIDIVQTPLFAIIEDEFEDVFLVAFDPHGEVWTESFHKGTLESLTAYDDGFAGYTVQTELPFKAYDTSRQMRENAMAYLLEKQFRKAVSEKIELSPPLQLLMHNCQMTQTDFPEMATAFLVHWNASSRWLYPDHIPLPAQLKKLFGNLDWKGTPVKVRQGCSWMKRMFDQITPDLDRTTNPDADLVEALRKHKWPLLPALKADKAAKTNSSQEISAYTLLTLQIFAASEVLPLASPMDDNEEPEAQAGLFSAYLRAYGNHFADIVRLPENGEMDKVIESYKESKLAESSQPLQSSVIALETAVVAIQKPLLPGRKLEDNFPRITVLVNQGQRAQSLSLAYDSTGTGLKWPAMNGEYLLRFQPVFKEIPYRLRLRQARQINYANSSQPYSFESDLIVSDRRSNTLVETTISMNKVHETWDGYRFYLSSIAPPNETAIKQVQIVINYDPAKYLLTYPGAIVLSCGILMLFIMRPYRRSKE
ncbi:MAG TPA: hypothetical protein VGP47_10325 [Parachlamydiaceae bacterium]|nr:hypothetical protein [Parachlamydiaceae bacterium]